MSITPNYGKATRFVPQHAFKNNKLYTGSFTISGSIPPGAVTKTFTLALSSAPDLLQAVFNTTATSIFYTSPYPSTSWWKQGIVTDDAGGLGARWQISWQLNGTTITFTATTVNTTSTTYTSSSPVVNYRLVDYSVF